MTSVERPLPTAEPLLQSTRIDPMRLNVLTAATVVLAYLFTSSRVSENPQTLGVIAMFLALLIPLASRYLWLCWAVAGAALAVGILARPLDVPNHHFMLTYTCAALALSLSAPLGERQEHVRNNARWLLVALFGVATVQRIFQPGFMDGSYIGYELSRGGFAGPVLRLFGDVSEVLQNNNEAIVAFRNTPPSEATSLMLKAPFPGVAQLTQLFVWTILAIEVWICGLFLLRPHSRLAHYSLWAFAITLGVLRQEFTFISVACLLGLLSCDTEYRRIRQGYALFALVFAALVLKTLNGA